jgi:hypothetical protein
MSARVTGSSLLTAMVASLAMLVAAARAEAAPRGYRCTHGAKVAGVGCRCDAGYQPAFTSHRIAICKKARTTPPIVVSRPIATPQPPPDAVNVLVRADFDEASVAVDGAAWPGTTPLMIRLMPGPHVITVTWRALTPFKQQIDVQAGVPSTVYARVSGLPASATMTDRVSCDQGSPEACGRLGLALLRSSKREVQPGGLAILQRICDGGNAEGCVGVGWAYDNGLGLPAADLTKAAELYRRGCDAGIVMGCYDLGKMYSDGRGVESSDARAAELFDGACQQSSGPACNVLGTFYANGRLGDADPSRAAGLYQRACGLDNMNGCSNLAQLYRDGRGVPADPARARQLFDQACRGGIQIACDQLAQLPP